MASINRLALLEDAAQVLARHLEASAPNEDGAFCLVRAGKGIQGSRLLVTEAILPSPGSWEIQTPHNLRPSAQWVSAAVSRAVDAGTGLLFVHSHPNERFPQGFSPVDADAFASLAQTLAPMLDGPFAAAIVHPNGWSGVVWIDGTIVPVERVVSVGRTLRFLSPVPIQPVSEIDSRQVDALGVVHNRLRNLTVGVVGCGGLGSPTAEQLFRMGVNSLVLIDPDRLDTPSNIRRVFGATTKHLRAKVPRPKVRVVERHLNSIGLETSIRAVRGDVRVERIFRELLDADVVLAGTDTHGSRAVVNDLASTYLLPVIDVGVRVGGKSDRRLCGLLAEVRVLTPNTPCLWCRRTISADVIRAENMPEDERRQLEREGYVVGGVGDPVPSVIALTVLGSGLATCALVTLLAEEGEVAPPGYWVDGFLGDGRMVGPQEPLADCRCRERVGLGDSAPPPFIAAETATRRKRKVIRIRPPAKSV